MNYNIQLFELLPILLLRIWQIFDKDDHAVGFVRGSRKPPSLSTSTSNILCFLLSLFLIHDEGQIKLIRITLLYGPVRVS